MCLKQQLKFIKDVLFQKDLYYPIQKKEKTLWMGNEYGGFYVVPSALDSKSIVYSFGIGEDISFDEEVIKTFGCKVFAFDPTPKTKLFIEKVKPTNSFIFFDVGIAAYDGLTKFYLPENKDYISCTTYNRWKYDESILKPIEVPVKRLITLMNDLGHTHIDLLKMDIEGSEYDVIPDILQSSIPINQILIEVHHRFEGIGLNKTKEMIHRLNMVGYKIAAISDSRDEYTFIK